MTVKFDFKKQKIRGWKRRLRDVEYWVMNNKDIDLGWLEERNMNYSKLWIHPFFSLKVHSTKLVQAPINSGIARCLSFLGNCFTGNW